MRRTMRFVNILYLFILEYLSFEYLLFIPISPTGYKIFNPYQKLLYAKMIKCKKVQKV